MKRVKENKGDSFIVLLIDEYLLKNNLSHKDFSDLLNKSEQQISNIKLGKTKGIKWDLLLKICNTLKCTPGDIIKIKTSID